MIRRLYLENYRGFKSYTLTNLSRVNLLVGRNNSGKTSILEAVQLLGEDAELRTLDWIARRRGETTIVFADSSRSTSSRLPDISHFFHGHSIEPGIVFSLQSDGEAGGKTFEILDPLDYFRDERFKPTAGIDAFDSSDLVLNVDGSKSHGTFWQSPHAAPISEGGAMDLRRILPRHNRAIMARRDEPQFLLIPQEALDRSLLAQMWNLIITEGREGEVVQAMQILEPNLTSIAFLSGYASAEDDPRGSVLIGFRGEAQRRPLGSHGEGMRRLLTLALSLVRSKNGVLLVDEVDTGLHYSILGDVWQLIVETAVRLDIQVFLTTHSLDCLRGLSWFCGARPDLADEVSVQKIERELAESVALNAAQIQMAVDHDIEVR